MDNWRGETCKTCGRDQRLAWWVEDKLWGKVIPIDKQTKVTCLECFLKYAEEKEIYPKLSDIHLEGIAYEENDLLLTDEEIYNAALVGFDKKVEATNLTDEIELKKFEGLKQVAINQLSTVLTELPKRLTGLSDEEIKQLAAIVWMEKYGYKFLGQFTLDDCPEFGDRVSKATLQKVIDTINKIKEEANQ